MAQTSSVARTAAPITEITADDIAALGVGTAIFGTGGGGAVYTSQIMVETALREHGPVRLVQVDDLTADDVVILMSGIGAPTVGIEMLAAKDQIHALLAEAERLLGRKVTTLMAAEIGEATACSRSAGPPASACRSSTPTAWAGRSRMPRWWR